LHDFAIQHTDGKMGGTGPLIGVLACGRCVQVNIQGNVMEGLGGPAIVVNDVLGLTIQANYFEGNDENAWRWGAPHHLTHPRQKGSWENPLR